MSSVETATKSNESAPSRNKTSFHRRRPSRSRLFRRGSSSASTSGFWNGKHGSVAASARKAVEEASSRFRSFRIRFYSTVVLIALFTGIVYAGHVPLMFMVFAIQTVMVKELFALARVAQQERKLTGFRAQQWFFYIVAALWVYVRFIKNNLMVEITSSASLARILGWVLREHTLICFSLYTAGFVSFVLTLRKGMYTYQFGQYAWTHMILMVVFVPSSFFVSNIFDGIIWFLLPCALVIVNDIAAYLAGFFFGRTPLIVLSPKKTWEGFIGGALGTILASWYLAAIMSRSAWLTCPRTDLSIWQPMECQSPPEIFLPREWDLGKHIRYSVLTDLAPKGSMKKLWHLFSVLASPLLSSLRGVKVYASPMQFHSIALALFASAIAPFGGFFASGFKRGFKIKDFGHSIPGHGGMTDRMDCQVVMAAFSYIYYHTFVSRTSGNVGAVLAAAMKLTTADQLELLEHLANALVGEQVLPLQIAKSIEGIVHPSLR